MDTNSTMQSTVPVIDKTTITSLGAVVIILQAAYLTSRQVLDRNTKGKQRVLFVWHVFNALIHFVFEGTYLYNCFFVSAPIIESTPVPDNNFRGLHPLITSLLTKFFPTVFSFPANPETHVYGARYGTGPTSLLWQEYAKADSRFGGADLTTISLELLTVVIGGPLALWCAYGIARRRADAGFWMTILAVGEIYGGFMTFAPEWLTGSVNLDTSNAMYLWLYLAFFNLLWVAFPLMSIFVFYEDISNAFKMRKAVYVAAAKQRDNMANFKTPSKPPKKNTEKPKQKK